MTTIDLEAGLLTDEPTDYRDGNDQAAQRWAKRIKPEMLEQYFQVRNFIHEASGNLAVAIDRILRDFKIDPSALSFGIGHEDSEHEGWETRLDQFWSCRILDPDCRRFNIYFPAKVFWMKQDDIVKWFMSDRDGKMQVKKLLHWCKPGLYAEPDDSILGRIVSDIQDEMELEVK